MVRDRLNEFQSRFNDYNTATSAANPVFNPYNNPLSANSPQSPDEINVSRLAYDTADRAQRFLQHVDALRKNIDQLQKRVHNLQQRQAAVLSQTIVKVEEKEQLSALIEEIKLKTKSLRPQVRQLEADLRRDEAAPTNDAQRTGAELRIRRNQCEMLKLRLNELLALFNHAQIEYRQRVSKRVKRQLDLAGTHLSSSVVDKMLASNSNEIFYRQVNPLSMAAQMALDDATSRHNELMKLEQSITELHDIFKDMYDLVHSQNETVDHIAINVESANEFTHDAQIKIKHAVSYKKAAQRKKCLITLIRCFKK